MRKVLQEVADLVYRLLPEIQSRRHEVTWKSDDSPVTTADLLVEEKITELLHQRFPGIVVFGEESYSSSIDFYRSGWAAVLDPIDGTENFCSGLKEWGVSLSIWQDYQHRGSLLLLPELAVQLMSGDSVPQLRSRILGVSSTISEEAISALRGVHEARILGCAVYNLYSVTCGALARFVNPKGAYAWDLLAGVMLAREHRCDILIDEEPYDGRFLSADRRYRVDIRHRYDLHNR